MRTIIALFVVAIAIGAGTPAQAASNYIVSKDVAYAANPLGGPRVSSLDIASGATVWTTTLPGPSDLTLSLTLDKSAIYVTGASASIAPNIGFLWALDATTGQLLWFTSMPGGGIYSSATVDKDVIYVSGGADSPPSRTSAVNAVTGGVLWQTNTPHPAFSSPSINKDSLVVATGGFPGYPVVLVALDPATGQIQHTFPVP